MSAETSPSTPFTLTPEEQQWMDSHADAFSCGSYFSHTAQVTQTETFVRLGTSTPPSELKLWELIGSDAARIQPEHGYTL